MICFTLMYPGSLYCSACQTYERLLGCRGSARADQGALLGYQLPLVVFSILFNIPKFFEFSTESYFSEEDLLHLPYVAPTEFRSSPDYKPCVLGAQLVFSGVLPITSVLVLNLLLHKASSPLGDRPALARQWLGPVLLVSCHLPRVVLNAYELSLAHPSTLPLHLAWLVDLSHLLLTLAAASTTTTALLQDTSLSKVARGSLTRWRLPADQEVGEEEGTEVLTLC